MEDAVQSSTKIKHCTALILNTSVSICNTTDLYKWVIQMESRCQRSGVMTRNRMWYTEISSNIHVFPMPTLPVSCNVVLILNVGLRYDQVWQNNAAILFGLIRISKLAFKKHNWILNYKLLKKSTHKLLTSVFNTHYFPIHIPQVSYII